MQKDYLEIILEDINGKFDLVLEGHAALDRKIDIKFGELSEKIDVNNFKIGALNDKINAVDESLGSKIEAVAKDLKAHRQDTEAHQNVYQVKEG